MRETAQARGRFGPLQIAAQDDSFLRSIVNPTEPFVPGRNGMNCCYVHIRVAESLPIKGRSSALTGASRQMFKRVLKLAMLLICLGLFALLVAETGPAVVASRVYDVGLGFLLLILISGIRHLLRASAWYFAIEPKQRRVRFRDRFGIR